MPSCDRVAHKKTSVLGPDSLNSDPDSLNSDPDPYPDIFLNTDPDPGCC